MPNYRVYAVKYAQRDARRPEHFYEGDPRDEPMPMDYFVWAAVSDEHTVVVDTGFTAEVAVHRGRQHLRCPTEGLRRIGVEAERVQHVVLTHFHYDHVGNVDKFPNARFVVQEREMAFWTGRMLSTRVFQHHVELDDLLWLLRANFAGRLRFVDGTAEVVPGVTVHLVGGHTAGIQVVRVQTERGPLVLASDASHYYANFEENRPFSIVTDVPAMYRAFDTLRELAGAPERVIPGHDPLVLQRFPAVEGLEGVAARLA